MRGGDRSLAETTSRIDLGLEVHAQEFLLLSTSIFSLGWQIRLSGRGSAEEQRGIKGS